MNGTPRVVRHGVKTGVVQNRCNENAMLNVDAINAFHMDKVLDGDEKNVRMVVGSMGFGPCKIWRNKVWWEYGNPKWKTAEAFLKDDGKYDVHVWVEYIDTNGDVITIDPWFDYYSNICAMHRVSLNDNGQADRHYHEIEDRTVQQTLMLAMTLTSRGMKL